jgi:hypothetical protein
MLNYPAEVNSAEIVRCAAIHVAEKGLSVCFPIHDAFLIEAPSAEIEDAAMALRRIMDDASET